MLKKDARAVYRKKRMQLTDQQRMKLDDLILIQLQKINLPFLSVLLSFHPIEELNEIDTFSITRYFQFKNPGIKIAYPKTDFTNRFMQAIICEDEDLFEKNPFNIYEPVHCEAIDPVEIDLVLLPLLAFDQKGYRVGYGKGFYDRFLMQCRPECIKLGLSYFEPLDVLDDANDFDVPLDYCITPQKAYVF